MSAALTAAGAPQLPPSGISSAADVAASASGICPAGGGRQPEVPYF